MTGRRHDLRLVPAATSAYLSGWLATGWDGTRCAWLGALALLGGLAALAVPALRRSGYGPPIALALIVAGLCCGTAAAHHRQRATDPMADLVTASATVQVWGTIHTDPKPRADPGEGDLTTLVQLSVTEFQAASSGPSRLTVLVLGPSTWQSLAPGDQVWARGRLRPTEPADSVDGLLIAQEVEPDRPATGLPRVANRMRSGLLAASADLPADARALIPGIAVGDTTRFDQDLSEAMRGAGLTHITAVSGAHVVIIIGALSWLLSLLGTRRLPKAAVLICGLGFFVLLVRPEPSVLRAASMGLIGVLAMVAGRPRWALPALLTAVCVLTALDPWLTRSYGFALSASATAALVTLAPWWTRHLATIMPRAIAGMIAIPAAAQAVCAPIIVLFAPAVSLVAVPANLAAMPAVAPVTIAGVLAALISPVCPPAASVLAAIASLPARWIGAVARWSTSLSWSQLPWPGGPGGAVVLAISTAAVLAGAGWLVGRGRRTAAVAATLVVALGAACALPPVWHQVLRMATPALAMSEWQVAVCDVGQGSTTLVRTGASSALVVDVGPNSPAAAQCLDRLGVRRITALVISHFHADHVGGLARVVAGRRIERVLAPTSCDSDGEVRNAIDILDAAHTPIEWIDPTSAPRTDRSGSVSWTVLAPAREGPCGLQGEGSQTNDSSLPVYTQAEGLSLLVLGDAEEDGQRRALDHLKALPEPVAVDVVVVPHHGSARQYAPLARYLAAPIAVISVGADNSYGHPTQSAIGLYREAGARIVRTDQCGTIAIAASEGGFDLNARCQPADHSGPPTASHAALEPTSCRPALRGRLRGWLVQRVQKSWWIGGGPSPRPWSLCWDRPICWPTALLRRSWPRCASRTGTWKSPTWTHRSMPAGS